jgi:hypothetical protein
MRHNGITSRGVPLPESGVPAGWKEAFPDYCTLLAEANGLEVLDGLVRVFGVGDNALGRDATKWNSSDWRNLYEVPSNIIFWGENVLGDQLGIDAKTRKMVLLFCEGGHLVELEAATPHQYIESLLSRDTIEWIDVDLINSGIRHGLRPSLTQHLCFVLPLICGGNSDLDNLEVMDGESHLQILGQIIQQTRGTPEGTLIQGFRGPERS